MVPALMPAHFCDTILTGKKVSAMMQNGPAGILEMTAWRMDTPEMFGMFHFLMLAAVCFLAAFASAGMTRVNEETRIRILAGCGWLLAVMEVYKQLFLFYVVNNGVYDWWYFPFQLCSVPMYLCIILPLVPRDGKTESAILDFLSCFTFVSAAAALIYPEDFLRSYVTLTLHGFIWHGLLLFISLTAALTGMADLTFRGFARASVLFLFLSGIAICINAFAEPSMAAAYSAGLIPENYAAMFYMNPYHLSPQPLVGTIQKSAGIPLGLALYAAVIIAVSGLCCAAFRYLSEKHHS